ncbi:hypothetical protein H6501_04660 [Candidatus Woesearchaeota archaeon]|nr:hypothetical protein [Nanoarchaeota archaeon]MCB9370864.1 hypothetical protein [Candidatus Woesearchaeota archaeon]USN43965.1 MAG: hypothetical protein H6500_06265 [Candidatus Woesearchaeota archaeon]
MTEKEKLISSLSEQSGKSIKEVTSLIKEKVNELSGLVSEEGAIYILANEMGVRLENDKPKRDVTLVKIQEITEPKMPVSFVCKVLQKYSKVSFSSEKGSSGAVQSLLVGDESALIRVVFWNDKTEVLETVNEGDILKILNAYTRENNRDTSRLEVHFGQYSEIEVNPKGIVVESLAYSAAPEFVHKSISELEEEQKNVKIKGVVTDFDIPRFYVGCPQCFRKVFADEDIHKCSEHGEVTAIKIPIVSAVVDDSTGNIVVVGFRDRAQQLMGMDAEEIIGLAEDMDKYKAFTKRIVGAKVELGGNISQSSVTGDKQLVVNSLLTIEMKSVDEIAKELIEEEKIKGKTAAKKEESPKVEDDDDDLDIEEIDIDEDLL